MFCPTCGARIEGTPRFCSRCGAALSTAGAPTAPAARSSERLDPLDQEFEWVVTAAPKTGKSAAIEKMTQALESAKKARDAGQDVTEARRILKQARMAFENQNWEEAMHLSDQILKMLAPPAAASPAWSPPTAAHVPQTAPAWRAPPLHAAPQPAYGPPTATAPASPTVMTIIGFVFVVLAFIAAIVAFFLGEDEAYGWSAGVYLGAAVLFAIAGGFFYLGRRRSAMGLPPGTYPGR